MAILIGIFWLLISIPAYTYFGYPLILLFTTKLFPDKKKRDTGYQVWPKVSILVAAYNEEKVIKDKILNCLDLDYPKELLEIWIASDGSSDQTNSIVTSELQKNENVHLLVFGRSGKSVVINESIPQIKSEIIVFSDANTQYENAALKKLVRHFGNSNIGCVCGRLVYKNPQDIASGKGEGVYWKYETFLKVKESLIGYVAGANGAIYAIRQRVFEPLPIRTINDDFMISMKIVERGWKSIYEDNAIAYEDVAPNMESEFRRHVRDGAGHYIAIRHLWRLLNPLLGVRSFIYYSHRVFRWAVPFILLILFILNILIVKERFYFIIFLGQILFYSTAVLGLFFMKKNRSMPFVIYVPFYFCNLNAALLYGFVRVITGKQRMTWDRTER